MIYVVDGTTGAGESSPWSPGRKSEAIAVLLEQRQDSAVGSDGAQSAQRDRRLLDVHQDRVAEHGREWLEAGIGQ